MKTAEGSTRIAVGPVDEATIWSNFHDQGFAIIPEVFSASEVAAFLQSLAETPMRRSKAGARHILGLPLVSGLARDPRLLGMARQVLGSDAFPFRATLFEKSGDANWLVVWHQDTALPVRERREAAGWGPWSVKEGVLYAHATTDALSQVLALRVHLDDSVATNGPLRVLPGTHVLGVLSDGEIERLAGEKTPVECLVARGGVVAMSPLIVHSSSKCLLALPRRVLHIEYAATSEIGDGIELAVN